jgi:hypothetical protein
MPDGTVTFDLVALAAMAALTVASYHYVEAPMRRWRPSRLRVRAMRPRLPVVRVPSPRTVRARPATAIVACAVVAVLGFALQPAQHLEAVTPEVHVPAAGALKPSHSLSGHIDEAIGATRWPDLDPSLDEVVDDRVPEWKECASVHPGDADQCVFPPADGTSATRSAVVLGDSVAVSWLPGLRAALGPQGYTVHGLTLFQCGVAEVPMVEANRGADTKFVRGCTKHRTDTYDAIARLQPELVVMSSAENSMPRMVSHATGAAAQREWLAGMRNALRHVHAAAPNARVVVLSPPPAAANMGLCVSPNAGPRSCLTSIHAGWLQQSEVERRAAAEARAQYVDVHLLFCSKAGLCPPFIDGHLVRCDALHLTATEARLVAPYLRRALLAA